MLEMREELTALIAWEASDFNTATKTGIDAVAHRVLRMAELLRGIREIAQRN